MYNFEQVLKQYEKNLTKFPKNEERQKRHFITLLPKGSPGEQRRIRIYQPRTEQRHSKRSTSMKLRSTENG